MCTRACPGGILSSAPGDPWVNCDSLGSIARALGVIGFLRGVWIHAKATWGGRSCSLGLFRALYKSLDFPGLLGSLVYARGVVGFIRGRWVHTRAPWGSLRLSGVVGFSRERLGGRWVHPWFGFTRVRP